MDQAGFEPTCDMPDLQSGAFDHSATDPQNTLKPVLQLLKNNTTKTKNPPELSLRRVGVKRALCRLHGPSHATLFGFIAARSRAIARADVAV